MGMKSGSVGMVNTMRPAVMPPGWQSGTPQQPAVLKQGMMGMSPQQQPMAGAPTDGGGQKQSGPFRLTEEQKRKATMMRSK